MSERTKFVVGFLMIIGYAITLWLIIMEVRQRNKNK
jgi:hypothetical protein